MTKREKTTIFSILLCICLFFTACAQKEQQGKETEPQNGIALVSVVLSGGTGRAKIESPVEVRCENGELTAILRWSSSNYDYMMVNGEQYNPVNAGGNSVFEIPLPSLECTMEVQADTTAMGTPHLIDYVLTFGGEVPEEEAREVSASHDLTTFILEGLQQTGSMQLDFAKMFSVDYYEGGISLVHIAGDQHFLLVPEQSEMPENIPESVTVLKMPIQDIYLVASDAMDMFSSADAMGSLSFCAIDQNNWHIKAAVDAMKNGTLLYAGKYSAPDYERLMAGKCGLAIENTMVLHAPEVVEKLNNIGIPVLIEHTSYESTPQGRMEWIKLYGLLTDHTTEAENAFDKQIKAIESLSVSETGNATVAFFYVTNGGTVSVRNSSDYVPQMISLAGGQYAFSETGKGLTSATSVIQLEDFYSTAKNVDYLIYNSTIAGELHSLKDFLDLNPLFANLKAVKEEHVYCTTQNLYQSSMELGDFITDMNNMLSGNTAELQYLFPLS